MILKKTKIQKSLIPADNIVYSCYYSCVYNLKPFLPDREPKGMYGMYDFKNLVGKTVQILLPIEMAGVVNEYLFRFKVHDAGIK
ncbi:MAG: hypothetical protein ACK4UJ_05665 [Leptonema sp. (in: bacteria)]